MPSEAQALGLPGIPLDSIRFDCTEGTIDAVYAVAGQARIVPIPPETLAAMLINYCIRTRIPLPRVADKTVRVEADCVILAFKTWFDEPPVFEAQRVPAGAEKTAAWKLIEPGRPAHGF